MGSIVLPADLPPGRRLPFVTLVTVAGAVASGVVVVALMPPPALPQSPTLWMMAGLAVLADVRPFTPPGRRQVLVVFPSVALTFAILLAYGLAPAITVQAAAMAFSAVRNRPPLWRVGFHIALYVLALGAADLVLHAVAARPYSASALEDGFPVAGVTAAAGAWFVVRYTLTTLTLSLWGGGRWRRLVRRTLCWDSLTHGALLLISPVLVAASMVDAALVPLVIVPLFAVSRMGKLAERLTASARQDPLTGLANRPALVDAAVDLLPTHADLTARGVATSRLALLLLDLDRFKNVNDALGHEVGDQLLVEVAARLRAAVGPHDLVAYLGGDEFAVLAPRLSGAAEARALAGQVVAALAEPVRLTGLPLEVSGSVGVAVWPDHAPDAATLLRRADVAMYDAKQRAAPVAIYDPAADHHSPARLTLLADLRTALQTPGADGLTMHYQPQVAIGSGEVVGVEALLRWRHPTGGPVSPDEVIKVAEHTAVMNLLTLRIVDEVVEQMAKWAAAGVRLRTSINVSVRDLHSGEVAERLAGQLRRYGVAPGQLQLEITEGALMADPQRVLATLAALHRLGVAISLDDFGTGYSSLQHLRRLPLTEVKIDRSFVLGATRDPDDAAIVASVVELAGALGLRVVAEGVEDERTARLLAEAGCQVGQGWYYAYPMPGDELMSWLTGYQPRRSGGPEPAA